MATESDKNVDTSVVVDRIVPGPSVAWSEDSLRVAPEPKQPKSRQSQDVGITSNSNKGASGASTRRRHLATSLGSDNKSTTSSSSKATRRWINFPDDRLLAFGVSDFEGACEFAVPAGEVACHVCRMSRVAAYACCRLPRMRPTPAHTAEACACCRLAAPFALMQGMLPNDATASARAIVAFSSSFSATFCEAISS